MSGAANTSQTNLVMKLAHKVKLIYRFRKVGTSKIAIGDATNLSMQSAKYKMIQKG